MSAVPVCIVEEHHEAFFVWRWAVSNGIIPQAGNQLLHVDQHADIGTPRLRRPLPPLAADLGDVYRFTYDELCCFEFIVPAIFQGIIDEVVWIQLAPLQKADQIIVAHTLDAQETVFSLSGHNVTGGRPTIDQVPRRKGRAARYKLQSIADPLPPASSVILDFDLDYVSCEDAVNLVQRLAVTRDEYEAFMTDRYHFLRVNQGSRIRIVPENGKYYVYLRNFEERAPTPLRVSEAEIGRRLDALTAFLHRERVQPRLITIARSRFSGYTPTDQWAYIESGFLERLRGMFPVAVHTLDELASQLGISGSWPAEAEGRS